MSSIAAISATHTPVVTTQAPPVRATDADGDDDGTVAKVSKPAPAQAIAPATATKGNSVNNYA